MTVLIGLRCADGAVLACDSQETRFNYFRFWPKVHLVGERFVLLSAGDPTIGEALARRLEIKFKDAGQAGQTDRRRSAQLIEETVLALASEAGENAVKGRQVLIAGATPIGEVCLWALDQDEIYLREMRTWECYGSGIDAAEMLMRDFYFPEVSTREAVPLLTYVIYAVSEICLDCGGPVSVVLVSSEGVRLLEPAVVEAELGKVRPLMDRLRKELPRQALKGQLSLERLR